MKEKDPIDIEIGEMLKQKRLEAHLTQKDVAKKVGISLITYADIEHANVPFLNKGATIFMKICEVLDILPYAFFESLKNKKENK